MSVTLKTIAEYTKLSVTTVSRALKDGDDVKQPTIDRVKAAAKKLGYAPNLQGLSLKTGINYNLAVVIPMQNGNDSSCDINTLPLLSGLTAGLAKTPYTLSVIPSLPDQDPLDPVKYAVERRLAGGIIICNTKTRDERVTYLQEQKFPFITFGQTEMSTSHAFADEDNYDTGYRAASYLFQKGCKHIIMLSSSDEYTQACHKYYGMKRAAMEYGINFDRENDIINDLSIKTDYRNFFYNLMTKEEHPDGIFCNSEISSLGCVSGITDAGLVVNKDVYVISSETSNLPAFYIPPVSGLRMDLYEIGTVLSSNLIKLIEGEDPSKLQFLKKATFCSRQFTVSNIHLKKKEDLCPYAYVLCAVFYYYMLRTKLENKEFNKQMEYCVYRPHRHLQIQYS